MGTCLADAAWAAGFIDGEGSLNLNKDERGYVVMVAVSQVDVRALQHLVDLFGGSISKLAMRPDRPNMRQAWQWSVSSKKAATVLFEIYPHLVIKKDQALLLLEARSYIGKPYTNRLDAIREELVALRHKEWLEK